MLRSFKSSVVVALGREGTLEKNPRQEVDTPRLPERDHLDAEDCRHEPVPQEVCGNCGDQTDDRDDSNRQNSDPNSERQLS